MGKIRPGGSKTIAEEDSAERLDRLAGQAVHNDEIERVIETSPSALGTGR